MPGTNRICISEKSPIIAHHISTETSFVTLANRKIAGTFSEMIIIFQGILPRGFEFSLCMWDSYKIHFQSHGIDFMSWCSWRVMYHYSKNTHGNPILKTLLPPKSSPLTQLSIPHPLQKEKEKNILNLCLP